MMRPILPPLPLRNTDVDIHLSDPFIFNPDEEILRVAEAECDLEPDADPNCAPTQPSSEGYPVPHVQMPEERIIDYLVGRRIALAEVRAWLNATYPETDVTRQFEAKFVPELEDGT